MPFLFHGLQFIASDKRMISNTNEDSLLASKFFINLVLPNEYPCYD